VVEFFFISMGFDYFAMSIDCGSWLLGFEGCGSNFQWWWQFFLGNFGGEELVFVAKFW